MNNYACLICGSYFCDRRCHIKFMPTEPTPVPAPQPSLRKAALEALVAAEVYMEAESSNTNVRERLVKALEQLATELER